jgi:acyl-CoA thioesterase FadM
MKLVKSERLPASFCGADVKLSVEGAFRIVEDMVTEHMGDLRIDGVTCMREYGGMWVFVRNRIEMLQALEWMEEYTAECYISSFTKIRLYIDTVLRKKDGSVAVASRLELCALDLETGKIRKAATVGVGEKTPPQEPSGDVHEVVYSKVKLLKGAKLDEVKVGASDIDYCYHTNNISYVRYFMNQFSVDDLVERPVRAIEVQYVNQTHEGDRLEVYACEPAADKSDDVAAQSTQSGGAAEDYSTQAAYTEAYMIELDGKQVVSCQIVR